MCEGDCFEGSTINIPKGDTGPQGPQGEYGGYASNWLFNGSTASGTSATEIRLNNAAPASVTTIYVNDSNADSIDLSGFLASISNSGNYGNIRLFKESDSRIYAMYIVTNVVDSGSEYAITVTYVGSNGTFTAADSVVLEFTPKGSYATGALVYETLLDIEPFYEAIATESLIPGATYTIPTTGVFQINLTGQVVKTGNQGGSTEDAEVRLYVNNVLVATRKLAYFSYADASELIVHPTIFWRGAINATETVEVRVIEGAVPASRIIVTGVNMLINKEV